jgi:hypothetical protein
MCALRLGDQAGVALPALKANGAGPIENLYENGAPASGRERPIAPERMNESV